MTDIFKQKLAAPQVARWQYQGIECAIHYSPVYDSRNGYVLIPDLEALARAVDVLKPDTKSRDVERFAGPIYGLAMFAALQIGACAA